MLGKLLFTAAIALPLIGAPSFSRAEGLDVAGIVFEDANSNGVLDTGDKPLPGVVVSDGRAIAVTGKEGRYRIDTDAGRIVFVSVPGAHHAPRNGFYRRLSKSASALQRIDFPLVRNAELESEGRFKFAFVTDTHAADYRRASEGVSKAYKAVNDLNPAMVVHGGDIIFDAMRASEQSAAESQYKLYKNRLAPIIESPFYHAIGNHDVFGWISLQDSDPPPPLYGKKMYNKYFGPTYYSFNYEHCHFVVLDSIGKIKGESGGTTYHGFIDTVQLEWLRKDLAQVSRATPIVIVTHIPMINALASLFGLKSEVVIMPDGERIPKHQVYRFSRLLGGTLKGYNLKLVLAGHYHSYEEVHWKTSEHNALFVVGGSVSGEWWKGDHSAGASSWPEGFTLVEVDGEKFETSYIPYGWKGTEEQ